MYLRYREQAEFFTVYIREAHPTDGWRMSFNDQFQIAEAQPTTDDERKSVATRCCEALQMVCPLLVDGVDDKTAQDYAAFPDRLYLIDAAGNVAYKGGRGPFGYEPRELEQALILLLNE